MEISKLKGEAKTLRIAGVILGLAFLLIGILAFIKKDYLSLAEDGLLGVFLLTLSFVISHYLEARLNEMEAKEDPPDQGY